MIDIREQFAADMASFLFACAEDSETNFISMSGLPNRATIRGVYDFFAAADLLLAKYAVLELPEPNAMRGSVEPAWRIPNRYPIRSFGSTVNPTKPYNRNESDVPSLTIGLSAHEWLLPEALELAAAIVAAVRQAQAHETEIPDMQT